MDIALQQAMMYAKNTTNKYTISILPWSFRIVRNKMDKKNLQWLVRKINESYKEWLKTRLISNKQ